MRFEFFTSTTTSMGREEKAGWSLVTPPCRMADHRTLDTRSRGALSSGWQVNRSQSAQQATGQKTSLIATSRPSALALKFPPHSGCGLWDKLNQSIVASRPLPVGKFVMRTLLILNFAIENAPNEIPAHSIAERPAFGKRGRCCVLAFPRLEPVSKPCICYRRRF